MKCHNHSASIGSGLAKIEVLCQKIFVVQECDHHWKNTKITYFESTISPLLELQLRQFFF